MILNILKNFLGVTLLFLIAIVFFEIDAGVKRLDYFSLFKEALMMSLKFHIVVLPIVFLFPKKKDK